MNRIATALALVLVAATGGCQLIASLTGYETRDTGAGGATAASTGGSGGSGGSTATAGGQMGGGGSDPCAGGPDTIAYVQPTATGAGSGKDWKNSSTLTQTLAFAASCGKPLEIWAMTGTYLPGKDTAATFTIAKNVALYGGFAGGETMRDQRDPLANVTVLSGDVDGDDGNTGGVILPANIKGKNAYHVVTFAGSDNTATLDGFTITAGRADGASDADKRGAGITVTDASPKFAHLTLLGNWATSDGGGAYLAGGTSSWLDVRFIGNRANGDGGGVYCGGGATFVNPLLSGNDAGGNGGAIFFTGAGPQKLANATISGNRSGTGGGGVHASMAMSVELDNSIVAKNAIGGMVGTLGANITNLTATPTIKYTLVQGSGASGAGWKMAAGNDGGNNLDGDPLFRGDVDATKVPLAGGDLRLQHKSPAVNAGLNNLAGDPKDLAGNPRSYYGTTDMGALELYVPCVAKTFVAIDASGQGTGGSWQDAFPSLSDALLHAQRCAITMDVLVKKGVYKPGAAVTDTFVLSSNVSVYGGFAGSEMAPPGDSKTNPTVLSGDVGNDDKVDAGGVTLLPSDIKPNNAYHVLVANGAKMAKLDGFTITAGRTPEGDAAVDGYGGGLFARNNASLTLSNLKFIGNIGRHGAAIAVSDGSTLTVSTTTIQSNEATNDGAVRINTGGATSWTNVAFIANASDLNSGTFSFSTGDHAFTNVLFSGNKSQAGGAMEGGGGKITLINVTVAGNRAEGGTWGLDLGGGVTAGSTLTNCVMDNNFGASQDNPIFIGGNAANLMVDHSMIKGCKPGGTWAPAKCGTDGGNNIIDSVAGFKSLGNAMTAPSTAGDYRLNTATLADKGDGAAAASKNKTMVDLDNTARFKNTIIDLGAYEK